MFFANMKEIGVMMAMDIEVSFEAADFHIGTVFAMERKFL